MRKPTRPREVGRGERVLPGVWRLRLPLDLPGVPHVNAWALKAGRGLVLVDTGLHDRGTMGHLEQALDRTGHSVRDIDLIVITHAHIDHCGQAPPLARRARCEVWMHPKWRLHAPDDLDKTIEIALLSGVPEGPLRRWAEARRGMGTGQAGELYADKDLVPGVTVDTDAGTWNVIETPGHAPSHVCLHQPEQRLLITGDHLLGRVSQYFDVGYTPDPVGEFLESLTVVERLDARLALAGHARPFTDIQAHIDANRAEVRRRVDATRAALADGPKSAYEVARTVYGEAFNELMASWLMTMTRAWLVHLQRLGEVLNDGADPVQHWELAS
ncbi:MBL fold metallo-hydrolase [Solirubrobacter sp. CPCC 204708]|uniref:MBL fold metallo-hydrolase n=1 Tax=Solirubrobacter deserti TaxID=2282478 RepID=A0ABT4REZ1_9ACTN|nr:MBL fold metallo-hydrolase [Solirubrobacter deserti]MBE2318468.1 MBL fold metallo-hydrolase [Solirubrobacter deserti]MDA0136926.1 MBL fold metallo-hydrolase [Solirubrobacter deserti]